MKCTECGKPGAKRDHIKEWRGRRHWVAFCGPACKDEYAKRRAAYAKEAAAHDPFRC